MSSPSRDNEEPLWNINNIQLEDSGSGEEAASSGHRRPPAKRRLSNTVIEISDTDSDDSDVCAVNSYQASADEVKRIRGAEYSSSSSSSDYSSDSESPWEDDSIVVKDYNINLNPVKAQLNPRANRMDDPKLNDALKKDDVIDNLKSHWEAMRDLKSDEVILTCDPFRVCLLHNFLQNPEIINNIVDDMNTLDWSRKKMDLYEFHQTADLANLTWQRSIRGIYELLKTEVMSWVARVTGLELRSVSASCSLYGPGDHLLVHDDLLADRRVAFILYLAPWTPRVPPSCQNGVKQDGDNGAHLPEAVTEASGGWTPAMGGALELLACGDAGPTSVVRSVLPRNNTLAFFRVGTDSYHQVAEVVSLELPRLSINGWFHGPAPPATEPPIAPPSPPPPTAHPPHSRIVVLKEWIATAYMSPRSRAQVQAQMELQSEVCLRDVLLPAQYQRLADALKAPDVEWEWAGPAHQRRYQRATAEWLRGAEDDPPHAVREVHSLLSSAAFLRMLAECTDLALATYERLEVQRWPPGSFTLLPPRAHYQSGRLELVMYVEAPPRAAQGAATAYVAPEEPEPHADADASALVTVPPRSNALSLVYCDAGAAAFTKYLPRLAMRDHPALYIFVATYRE